MSAQLTVDLKSFWSFSVSTEGDHTYLEFIVLRLLPSSLKLSYFWRPNAN